MLDVAIRGGTVVDGTGRPGFRADVGIVDGRIVAIGDLDDDAATRSTPTGRVVSPGFVDVHTHYDAQLFWDPTCSPSPLHGVTTVVAGNCGISLAPVARDDEDFMTRLLSRVEAIPLESLDAGTDVRLEHVPRVPRRRRRRSRSRSTSASSSATRRCAGTSWGRRHRRHRDASTDQLARWSALLGEAIAAGALGFSSSKSRTQLDGDGRPTPPNFAPTTSSSRCRRRPVSIRGRASSTSRSRRRTASTTRAVISR